MGKEYLEEEYGEGGEFYLPQSHGKPQGKADTIVDGNAAERLAEIVGECHPPRFCQQAEKQGFRSEEKEETECRDVCHCHGIGTYGIQQRMDGKPPAMFRSGTVSIEY